MLTSSKPAESGKPRLRFKGFADEQTRESLRQGAMDFGAGCFAAIAIRNPSGIFRTISSSYPNRTRTSDWRRCRSSPGGSTNPRLSSGTSSTLGMAVLRMAGWGDYARVGSAVGR